MKILENKFFQFLIFVLMIVVIFFFLTLINEKSQGDNSNVITVTGIGEVYASPDVGVINISVKTENKDVSVASSENNEKMNNIIAFLKSENIEQKDIKTTGYNIYPRYDWDRYGKRTLAAYEVTQTINVKIRDLSKIGKVISESTVKGANDIGSLSFIVDNDEELKEQAKEIAIKNAREKAKNIEKALGVKMTKIVNFSENSYSPVRYNYDSYSSGVMLEKAMSSVSPTIETGENKITSNVVITYAVR